MSFVHRLPLILTAIAVALACLTPVVLRSADPELAGAAILISVLVAGAGVGASVVSDDPHR